MITKVKLTNWRSHLNSELNFSTGTNALLGHMGSGKTTILDSICFGLFGTFPTLQTKKLKLDDVLMKRPIEKDRAEVEINFKSDGKNYSVKRILEKKKGTSYSEIRENDRLLDSPNSSRVTEIVEKILKVNYDLFSKAIYSEQNALDYFLTIPKGQRMRKIDELLMIDKFEKSRSSAVSLVNRIAERKLAKQSVVDQVNVEELQRTISNLEEILTQTLEEKSSLEKNIIDISVERKTLESEVSNLQKIREDLEILKREEKGVSAAINETTISLQMLEISLKNVDKEALQKNLDAFTRVVKELGDMFLEKEREYQKLQEQTAKSKAELEFLKKERIDRLEREIENKLNTKREFDRIRKSIGSDVEKELESKKLLVEKFVGEMEAIRIRMRDMIEVLQQLSSVKAACPICESKLTEARKITLIKQKENQIEKLRDGLEKASKNKQIAEKDLKELELAANKLNQMIVEIRDFDKIKTDLDNAKNIYSILTESSMKLDKELFALRSEMVNYQSKLKDDTNKKQQLEILSLQLRDYQIKKARIEELFKHREAFVKHIEELEKAMGGGNLINLEIELRNSLAKEKEITAKIFGIDQIVKEKSIRLKDFGQTLANTLKEKENIRKFDKLIKELKIFESALEQTQIELRKEFVTAVNYTMNQLWNTLYPYQDFIGIRLFIEEGDYILQIQSKAGEWINVEGVASGGERSLSALALRIAFALVLAPQIRILILDEPTANLDSNAVSVLATTLREKISEFIDQTFLITHQAELEDAVTGNSYKLERDKSKDGVTKVIQLS